MAELIQIKELPQEVKDYLAKFDLSLCFTCGTCVGGCPITGDPDVEGWDIRKALRAITMGLVDEVAASKFPWVCTGCGRCANACPMGIDIPYIMLYMKSLRDRDEVPGVLHKGCQHNIDVGNNMAVPQEDYYFLMSDIGEEMADEGYPGFYVPIDKDGADILFYPNSKEVFADNDDMKWWWQIFYAARESWTLPSDNWESVDWGLFTGNYDAINLFAQRKIDHMKKFHIGRMIMPDCGGGSYGCRLGMKKCVMEDPGNEIEAVYLYTYIKELIEQGRIKLDKSVHAGKTFTWHDSCKHGRELMRHFGEAFFDEPRWIIEQCVDSYVEMYPSKMNSFCCGAGGGMWPGPYEDSSTYQGRMKFESIKNTGADVVVVACSNCHDQIMKRLPKHYEDYEYEVKYLWQLVAEALVVEPLTDEEVEQAQTDLKAQWGRLGFDPADIDF